MRKIISDSSSLILLYKCGAADLLLNNSRCIVPESVRNELTAPEHAGVSFFSKSFAAGRIYVMEAPATIPVSIKMGAGEREVISLYKSGSGDYVIIDDGKGAAYCRRDGVPFINALLAVKLLFFKKLILKEDMDVMLGWLKINGRYSCEVIDWAVAADEAVLSQFLF